MKQIIVNICLLLSVLGVSAQPATTVAYFEQLEWNFGVIQEAEGKVSHSFHYTNGGEKPLIFYSVNTSCGCTTPSYRKEPLMPGKSDDFVVTFDPTGRPGRFEKYIIIQGNMEGNNVTIKIKGVVEQKPIGIEEKYPIMLSKGIRLSDSQIDVGAIPNTRNSIGKVDFYNNSDTPVKVSIKSEGLPSWISISSPEHIVQPHSSCIQTIAFTPTNDTWGRKSIMLPISIEDKVQPIEIYAHGDFTEDFALLSAYERNHAPYIMLSSYFYSFSDCKMGEKLTRTITILNKGKGPLIIRYIDYNKDKIGISLKKNELQVGESTTLDITVNSGTAEDVAEMIRVISNDPVYPVREIRIIAKIN